MSSAKTNKQTNIYIYVAHKRKKSYYWGDEGVSGLLPGFLITLIFIIYLYV